jgi:hypothetical protein
MAQNNLGGPDGDGDGADKPAADSHEVALAIEAIRASYETAERRPGDFLL